MDAPPEDSSLLGALWNGIGSGINALLSALSSAEPDTLPTAPEQPRSLAPPVASTSPTRRRHHLHLRPSDDLDMSQPAHPLQDDTRFSATPLQMSRLVPVSACKPSSPQQPCPLPVLEAPAGAGSEDRDHGSSSEELAAHPQQRVLRAAAVATVMASTPDAPSGCADGSHDTTPAADLKTLPALPAVHAAPAQGAPLPILGVAQQARPDLQLPAASLQAPLQCPPADARAEPPAHDPIVIDNRRRIFAAALRQCINGGGGHPPPPAASALTTTQPAIQKERQPTPSGPPEDSQSWLSSKLWRRILATSLHTTCDPDLKWCRMVLHWHKLSDRLIPPCNATGMDIRAACSLLVPNAPAGALETANPRELAAGLTRRIMVLDSQPEGLYDTTVSPMSQRRLCSAFGKVGDPPLFLIRRGCFYTPVRYEGDPPVIPPDLVRDNGTPEHAAWGILRFQRMLNTPSPRDQRSKVYQDALVVRDQEQLIPLSLDRKTLRASVLVASLGVAGDISTATATLESVRRRTGYNDFQALTATLQVRLFVHYVDKGGVLRRRSVQPPVSFRGQVVKDIHVLRVDADCGSRGTSHHYFPLVPANTTPGTLSSTLAASRTSMTSVTTDELFDTLQPAAERVSTSLSRTTANSYRGHHARPAPGPLSTGPSQHVPSCQLASASLSVHALAGNGQRCNRGRLYNKRAAWASKPLHQAASL